MRTSALRLLAAGCVLGGAGVLAGCAVHAQQFEAIGPTWTAELRDRTGSVRALRVRDPGLVLTDLTPDGLCLSNVEPNVVRIGWLGSSCGISAMFNVLPAADGPSLRYDLGADCAWGPDDRHVVDVEFDHPVDATAIEVTPGWEP